MRVVLAYPFEGNPPDTIVELDRRDALRMIGEGRARRAPDVVGPPTDDEPTPLEYSTVPQLRAYAALHGIELPKRAKRQELLELILEAEQAARATEPETPATGDEPHQEGTDVR